MAGPRKTAAARLKGAMEDVAGMCAEHFPHGWRHVAEHQDAVACEHGQWQRPDGEQSAGAPETAGTETPSEGAQEPAMPSESEGA